MLVGLVEPADVDHDHADAVVERSQRLLYGPEKLQKCSRFACTRLSAVIDGGRDASA